MKRRTCLRLLGAAVLGIPGLTPARATGRVPRIGYLVLSPLIDPPSPERIAFVQGLRALGYEEGRSIRIEYRSAEGDAERLAFLAEELVELGVDLIVAAGGTPARAAKDATATIPIVMLFAPDPVGMGLAETLAHPGGNLTGSSALAPELGAKRLELIHEALPTIRRVAVLWTSDNTASVPELEAMDTAARTLGIELRRLDARGIPLKINAAFVAMRRERPDALAVLPDLRLAAYRDIIPALALREKLPTIFGQGDFVLSGGLMSYAPHFPELARRAAGYVDRILRGASPATLPIEQPSRFKLMVNLQTAKTLGIRLPPGILVRADEIVGEPTG